ncbi:polyketide synthase dehydratase domain-containing protein, partial [Planomonospora algeriensis]
VVFSGRLSVAGQPWLADHVVNGTVIVPGAALVELVARAGEEVGCALVRELTIQAPLVLAAGSGVQVQVVVGAVQESGVRAVALHSRAQEAQDWTLHAQGELAARVAAPGFDAGVWPPAGAVVVDVEDLYERLAEIGLQYGPVFQGLRAAWRRDGEVFAEVVLPEQAHADAV